jgi:hypothetical protein
VSIKEIADGLAVLAARFPDARVYGFTDKIAVNLRPGQLELGAMVTTDMFEGGPTLLSPIHGGGEPFEMPRGWRVDGRVDPVFSYSTRR